MGSGSPGRAAITYPRDGDSMESSQAKPGKRRDGDAMSSRSKSKSNRVQPGANREGDSEFVKSTYVKSVQVQVKSRAAGREP